MFKIKFKNSGFEEIRRSTPVAKMVDEHARSIAAQAGRGYEWSSRQGKKGPAPSWNLKRGPGFQGRYRAIVYPGTFRAMYDNGSNNTLAK